MPFYLWPITSPCPVLAGYSWWSLGLAHAFLPCMSKIYLLLMRLPWLVCMVYRLFFTIFWFTFPLWHTLLRDWALLNGGLCFSPAHPFSCYHLLQYHSIIPTAKLFVSILLGLFGPAIYSSPKGLVRPLVLLLYHWRAFMSHLFSFGRLVPVFLS